MTKDHDRLEWRSGAYENDAKIGQKAQVAGYKADYSSKMGRRHQRFNAGPTMFGSLGKTR